MLATQILCWGDHDDDSISFFPSQVHLGSIFVHFWCAQHATFSSPVCDSTLQPKLPRRMCLRHIGHVLFLTSKPISASLLQTAGELLPALSPRLGCAPSQPHSYLHASATHPASPSPRSLLSHGACAPLRCITMLAAIGISFDTE